MRFWARLAAAVVALAGVAGLSMAPAWSAPGLDDVVEALGLSSEPADYVVLVDTSGSMNASGRYAGVRTELGSLVEGLDSDDRVSLLTFDSTVTRRFRGQVGSDPAAVLAGLPASASGLHTDIGAAIAAGLDELERPGTHRLAALILITDGKLDAPGSAYESVKSAAWKSLRARAGALGAGHQVAAYAVSLQASTDAGLLKKVFPHASEVSAEQVGDRFARLGGDKLRLQAADALKGEVARAITVTWSGDLGAALANGAPAAVELTFTSPYDHVPVQLSDIRAHAPDGLVVEFSGFPERVRLDPGATVAVKGQVNVRGSAGAGATVGVSATVGSPWRRTMEKDLGLTFAPAIDGSAAVPPAAPAAPALPPALLPMAGALAALLACVVLVLLLARALLTPTMDGVLTFRRHGLDVAEIVLNGRRMKLVAPVVATELAGLSGSAAGARGGRGGGHAVRLELRLGAERSRGLVRDGGNLTFGDMEVIFLSGRSRILDKIGLPRSS